MMTLNGINSFYYSLILPRKKHVRNQLLHFDRYANDHEKLTATSATLAVLFLVDADNIDGAPYTKEDREIVDPILNAFLNGQNTVFHLSKAEVRVYIDLAMKRRLDIETNEILAVRLAEEYNKTNNNPFLCIDMDVFREVCRSIDKK